MPVNERRITAVPAGPPSTAAQGFECCDGGDSKEGGCLANHQQPRRASNAAPRLSIEGASPLFHYQQPPRASSAWTRHHEPSLLLLVSTTAAKGFEYLDKTP